MTLTVLTAVVGVLGGEGGEAENMAIGECQRGFLMYVYTVRIIYHGIICIYQTIYIHFLMCNSHRYDLLLQYYVLYTCCSS